MGQVTSHASIHAEKNEGVNPAQSRRATALPIKLIAPVCSRDGNIDARAREYEKTANTRRGKEPRRVLPKSRL
jgi:hypothetical protein